MKNAFCILLSAGLFIQCSPKVGFRNLENNTSSGLHGKLTAKEGKGRELVKLMPEASTLMESVKGCRLNAVGVESNSFKPSFPKRK